MEKDILTQTRFKTKGACTNLIKKLNALDEEVISATFEDIMTGDVGKKTLLPLIGIVGYKMKKSPDFQLPGDIYVAEALNEISNRKDPICAFLFTLSFSNENKEIFPLTIENIRAGKIQKSLLLKAIGNAGHKIKKHPEFQYSPNLYVAEALIEISHGGDPAIALKLKRGSRNKNHIVDDKRIALRAWHPININHIKADGVFLDLAKQFNDSESRIKKLYHKYKDEITHIFKTILKK